MAGGRIEQGEIYWLERGEPFGSEDGYRRPYLVIQNDRANRSALKTIIVCPLTSNLRRAAAPGNLVLEPAQSGLSARSVVNTSGIASLDRKRFGAPVGRVSRAQIGQIVAGVNRLLEPPVHAG
ncbi:MAG: type II toxin-antitoxin system PemK/MazF family toxin [Tepidiformaceae bacterium]